MSKLKIDADLHLKEDLNFYDQEITQIFLALMPKLWSTMKRHWLLSCFLSFLLGLELFLLLFCLSILAEYALVSMALAALFLTTFAYFTLRLYSQAKKSDELRELHAHFMAQLYELIGYKSHLPECNISVANACCKFADVLKDQEYHFFCPPPFLSFMHTFLRKLSCFCYWQDIFVIRERLLLSSVAEQIKWVRSEATSLEAHASLANAYVLLSHLYSTLANREAEEWWLKSKSYIQELADKFKEVASCAIEEFKILSIYAPHDPWVHEQLAYSYRDLQMPLEEIRAYEKILELNPHEIEILYKLGILYFKLGRNAQGLQVYEQLKKLHANKAEQLISCYGAYAASI